MKKSNLVIALMWCTLTAIAQSNTSSAPAVDPSTVIKGFFDAYRAHDRNKVNSLIHPEVVWIQPGTNRIAGVKKSRTEVLEMGQLSDKRIHLADIKILNATGKQCRLPAQVESRTAHWHGTRCGKHRCVYH